MTDKATRIVVLGASGLIGQALAEGLSLDGVAITAVARRYTAAQAAAFGPDAVTCPVVDLAPDELAGLLAKPAPDIVVNCLGVLQDGPRRRTRTVHDIFVDNLLRAIEMQRRPILLIHISIPGHATEDDTAFSRTKRAAERRIADSSTPFVILRPGFVIASGAYGGSALIRGLATLPFGLPDAVAERPFATVAIDDLVRLVATIADRWRAGRYEWNVIWDVFADERATVGDVVAAFRERFGGPQIVMHVPLWLLHAGARAGDAAAWLGWTPPIRTAALREMRRGVSGDPKPSIAASGITPSGLSTTLARLPATVQELWFARLVLLKPLLLVCLAIFWIASGLIALGPAFEPARAILLSHGFTERSATAVTWISSLADTCVGVAIACRPTCRAGLVIGIGQSLFYMAAAALITPDLWTEPLGALVKTGPAIVLMAVGLAILDAR